MSVDLKRVQAIFVVALDEPTTAARAEVVDRECGDDIALRQRVEALLHALDPPEIDLDQPVFPNMPTAARAVIEGGGAVVGRSSGPTGIFVPRPLTETNGTVIGAYKLREKIGEDGMGVVFLAEQESDGTWSSNRRAGLA